MNDLGLSPSENGIAPQTSASNGAASVGEWGTSLENHPLWDALMEQIAENRRAEVELYPVEGESVSA